MMCKPWQSLLTSNSPNIYRNWLTCHFPIKDNELVKELREESYQLERENPHKALAVSEILQAAAQLWGDQYTEAVGLLVEANARRLLGDHRAASQLYERSIQLFHQIGLSVEAARAAMAQLDSLIYLGCYDQAIALAKRVMTVFRAEEQPLQLGLALMNQGNIYARLSRFEEALASYEEAHQTFESLNSLQNLAMVEANQANVLSEMDDFDRAQRMYQHARARFAEAGLTSAVAQIDHNLACLAFALGDYHSALTTFDQVRRIFAAQENAMDIAFVDLYRSDIYLALNLWQDVLEMTHLTRQVFESAGMLWEVARLWLNEAVAFAHLGEYQSAINGLIEARNLFVQEKNDIWRAVTELYLATTALHNDKLDLAKEWAHLAQTEFSKAGLGSRTAECDIVLGEEALRSGEVARAKRHFEDAWTHLAQAELPVVAFKCHYGLARVAQFQQHIDGAAYHFRCAIDNIERLQATIGAEDYKMAFRSDKLQVYDAYISTCLTQAEDSLCEAFETIERAKSRVLLDALSRQNHASSWAVEQSHMLAQLARLKRELSWYYNRLHVPGADSGPRSPEQNAQLNVAIGNRERQVRKLLGALHNPDLVALPSSPISVVSLGNVQQSLPEDTLLLEYYVIDNQYVVFGVTCDTIWHHKLCVSRQEVTELLEQLRFQLNKFRYGSAYRQRHMTALRRGADACLHRLYNMLLEPIAAKLDTEKMIIVPHAELHAAPFHAFYDGKSYLLEQKIVSYAPSATMFHHLISGEEVQPDARPVIIGVADETIPHAQTEAETVARLFDHASLYVGEGATTNVLQNNAMRPAFLHLSTHAVFRSDNPLFSALKMADGWLTVNDVYSMSDIAPLVTLSACETGRHRVATGDELMGLCRGFFSAGAQSLVVSLWAADDRVTAELMSSFYAKLLKGFSVQQALQEAQLETMTTHCHPYFWAPFILIGNPLYRMKFKPHT